MGLDTVELVMAVEEEFSIAIPNTDAPNLVTVGAIHAYILQTLQLRGERPDEAELWERLKALVIDQLGVRPEEVTPSARIVQDLGAD